MGFSISKNQGSGRAVIAVTPEEKNTSGKDIIQVLTVEAVDGSTKEVKLIHRAGDDESKGYFLLANNLSNTLAQAVSNMNHSEDEDSTLGIYLFLVSTDAKGNKLQYTVQSDNPFLTNHFEKDEDGSGLVEAKKIQVDLGRPINLTQATHYVYIGFRENKGQTLQTGTITLTQDNTGKKATITITGDTTAAEYIITLNGMDDINKDMHEWVYVKGNNPVSLKRSDYAAFLPNGDSSGLPRWGNSWKPDTGLVCYEGLTKSRAQAGDTISVILWPRKTGEPEVSTEQEGVVVATFTLQSNDQSILVEQWYTLKIIGLSRTDIGSTYYLFPHNIKPTGKASEYKLKLALIDEGSGTTEGVARIFYTILGGFQVNAASPGTTTKITPGSSVDLYYSSNSLDKLILVKLNHTIVSQDDEWNIRK